jgi:hypothetical protein
VTERADNSTDSHVPSATLLDDATRTLQEEA